MVETAEVKLNAKQQDALVTIETPFAIELARMERDGIALDIDRLDETMGELANAHLSKALKEWGRMFPPEADPETGGRVRELPLAVALRVQPVRRAGSAGDVEAVHVPSKHVTVGEVMTRNPITVTPDMTIATEEIFGPVFAIIEVTSDAHALAVANDLTDQHDVGAGVFGGGRGDDTFLATDDAFTYVFTDGWGHDTVYGSSTGEHVLDFTRRSLTMMSGMGV